MLFSPSILLQGLLLFWALERNIFCICWNVCQAEQNTAIPLLKWRPCNGWLNTLGEMNVHIQAWSCGLSSSGLPPQGTGTVPLPCVCDWVILIIEIAAASCPWGCTVTALTQEPEIAPIQFKHLCPCWSTRWSAGPSFKTLLTDSLFTTCHFSKYNFKMQWGKHSNGTPKGRLLVFVPLI